MESYICGSTYNNSSFLRKSRNGKWTIKPCLFEFGALDLDVVKNISSEHKIWAENLVADKDELGILLRDIGKTSQQIPGDGMLRMITTKNNLKTTKAKSIVFQKSILPTGQRRKEFVNVPISSDAKEVKHRLTLSLGEWVREGLPIAIRKLCEVAGDTRLTKVRIDSAPGQFLKGESSFEEVFSKELKIEDLDIYQKIALGLYMSGSMTCSTLIELDGLGLIDQVLASMVGKMEEGQQLYGKINRDGQTKLYVTRNRRQWLCFNMKVKQMAALVEP